MAEYKLKIKTLSDSEANFEQNCRLTFFIIYLFFCVDKKHNFDIAPRMIEIGVPRAQIMIIGNSVMEYSCYLGPPTGLTGLAVT